MTQWSHEDVLKSAYQRAERAEDALLEFLEATAENKPKRMFDATKRALDVLVATKRQRIVDRLVEMKAVIVEKLDQTGG